MLGELLFGGILGGVLLYLFLGIVVFRAWLRCLEQVVDAVLAVFE